MKSFIATIVSIAAIAGSASAFAPGHALAGLHKSAVAAPVVTTTSPFQEDASYHRQQPHVAIQRQRSSTNASVQTMSLFGLGGPEIAIILIAGAFLLGPQKLAELGKEAGKMAGELKEVPKEFQEGLAEGEKEAQKLKREIAGDVKDAEKE